MSKKLTRALDRYREIEAILASPGVSSDPETYANLTKEYSSLASIASKSEEYSKAESEIGDLTALLQSERDPDLKSLCENELRDAKARLDALENELNALLLPKDPDDDKNVIVEIRAGAGGEEAALFVADLFRM
ncbi:MAG: PCRF domain-containing protein [Clostridia bacterium]|nr:PCRF domain-containing protein [Clostridia bacterium]